MSEEQKHIELKLPLVIKIADEGQYYITDSNYPNEVFICSVPNKDFAEFILKACNEYYDNQKLIKETHATLIKANELIISEFKIKNKLIEALGEVLEILDDESFADDEFPDGIHSKEINKARKTIAESKGEKP
jgi:hypothetical protein